jgi:hypothetical protein
MQRWLLLILVVATAQPALAQRTIRLAAGVTRSGDLAHDAVLDNTVLSLGLAPTVTVGVAMPITTHGSLRGLFEASYATSRLAATDATVSKDPLGRVATLSTSAMLDGPVSGALRWQAGVGVLFYLPTEHAGVFLDGAAHRYLVGGGLSWTHPLTSSINLLALGRYSFHEFTTPVLVSRGYSSYQSVHRFGVQLGVERRF